MAKKKKSGGMEQYGSWGSLKDALKQLNKKAPMWGSGWQVKQKGSLWAVFRPKK